MSTDTASSSLQTQPPEQQRETPEGSMNPSGRLDHLSYTQQLYLHWHRLMTQYWTEGQHNKSVEIAERFILQFDTPMLLRARSHMILAAANVAAATALTDAEEAISILDTMRERGKKVPNKTYYTAKQIATQIKEYCDKAAGEAIEEDNGMQQAEEDYEVLQMEMDDEVRQVEEDDDKVEEEVDDLPMAQDMAELSLQEEVPRHGVHTPRPSSPMSAATAGIAGDSEPTSLRDEPLYRPAGTPVESFGATPPASSQPANENKEQ